jgi:hypothetical protein
MRSADAALCPESRSVGSKVGLATLKALLTADALRRLDGGAYRFCADPACDVVYFDNAAGSVFRKPDLRTRVGLKERADPIPVCYCFDVTEADLRREIAATGDTAVPAMIASEVQAGHCACEVRNPRGTCCLGDVSTAVRAIHLESTSGAVSPSGEQCPEGIETADCAISRGKVSATSTT